MAADAKVARRQDHRTTARCDAVGAAVLMDAGAEAELYAGGAFRKREHHEHPHPERASYPSGDHVAVPSVAGFVRESLPEQSPLRVVCQLIGPSLIATVPSDLKT